MKEARIIKNKTSLDELEVYGLGTRETATDGIVVLHYKKLGMIRLRFWFNDAIHSEPLNMPLGEFLNQLHISLDDVQKALAEQSESEKEQN